VLTASDETWSSIGRDLLALAGAEQRRKEAPLRALP
jgi:hypothetical protein